MQNNSYITNIWKLFLVSMLCMALLASLVACNGGDEQTGDSSDVTESSEDAVSMPEDDVSVDVPFTDAALFETAPYSTGVTISAYNGTSSFVKIPAEINGAAVLAISTGAFKDVAEGDNACVITEIIVPDSVVMIDHGAFTGCEEIVSLTVPFSGGAADAHTYMGYVFGAVNPQSNKKSMPDTLQNLTVGGANIADMAFYGCENVRSIILTQAQQIGASAFEGCSSLRTLLMPDSVTSIGEKALQGCNSIVTLSLPYLGNGVDKLFLGAFFGANDYTENLEYVPSTLRNLTVTCPEELPVGAFYECKDLVTLTLKGNLKTVNEKAFYRCRRLKKLVIEYDGYTGISSIAPYSFAYCASLGEIQLAADVNEIPNGAFYSCASLRTLLIGGVENTLPKTHTDIGEEAFAYCESLPTLVLPEGLSQIKDKAFYGCADMTEINLPTGVKSIGNAAFMGCSSLKTVGLGSVETIGDGCFSYCYSLTELTVPVSVTSIGIKSFAYSSLKELAIKGNNVAVGNGAFEGCKNLTVDVNKNSETYKNLVAVGLGTANFKD